MSVIADILARCKALVEPIAPAANVFDYTPYSATEAGLKAIMLDDSTPPMIHFYAITREATPSVDKSIPAVDDKHKIVFRGWYGLTGDGGDSAKAFTEEIEAIRTAFLSNRSLKTPDGNGSDPKAFFCGPIQVRAQTTGSFVGYLVHYCDMTMEAEAYPIAYNNGA